jgi:hypothetical protein
MHLPSLMYFGEFAIPGFNKYVFMEIVPLKKIKKAPIFAEAYQNNYDKATFFAKVGKRCLFQDALLGSTGLC